MIEEIKSHLNCLVGEKCWRATNTVTGTLELYFGGALATKVRLVPDQYRFIGQYRILIWCTWRLDDKNDAICSSTSDDEQIAHVWYQHEGESVESVVLLPPVWDLVITFSSGKKLTVFCDNVQEPSSLTNRDFGINGAASYYVGRGQSIRKGKRGRDIVKDMFFPPSVVSQVVPPYSIEDRIKAVNTRIPDEELEKIAEQIKIMYPD